MENYITQQELNVVIVDQMTQRLQKLVKTGDPDDVEEAIETLRAVAITLETLPKKFCSKSSKREIRKLLENEKTNRDAKKRKTIVEEVKPEPL